MNHLFYYITVLMIWIVPISPSYLSATGPNPLNKEVSGFENNPRKIEISGELIAAREPKKHNPAFFISAESLKQKQKREGIILIDVRNSKEFKKFRIPGSLNIPIFSIKTKTFLKSKPIVLLNEGYGYSRLEKECRNLRDNGFTVSIIAGGLNYWREMGGSVEGDPFAQKELNIIPPRIFFIEKDYENWRMIDISQKENPESHRLIPPGINIPLFDNEDSFVSELKKLIGKQKSSPVLSILIFNKDGKQYEKLKALIKRKGIQENIFYLAGGLEGYKRFLYKRTLMGNKKSSLKQSVKGCRRCP